MTPSFAIASVETDAGRCWVAASDRGVVAIDRDESPAALLRWLRRRFGGAEPDIGPSTPLLERAVAAVRASLAGEAIPDVPIDTTGASDFERATWDAVRAVPRGAVVSYGAVAAAVGAPRAARAVGRVMARCPLWPLVPCHRVIHADGDIGGWGPDLDTKRRLLELERGLTAPSATSGTSRPRRSGPSRRPPAPWR